MDFGNIPSQTISLGVTKANPDDTVDSLCSRVDKALYKAKKSGKNKVEIIDLLIYSYWLSEKVIKI